MAGSNSVYETYLLRLWRDGEFGAWRLSLQNNATGERMGFADVGALSAFLAAQMVNDSLPADDKRTTAKR